MEHFKYYIAFSIAGTNAFIVAGRNDEPERRIKSLVPPFPEILVFDGDQMQPVPSRMPYPNGVKLLWPDINTKAGVPRRNPGQILNLFRRLKHRGWTVDESAFVPRHFRGPFKFKEELQHEQQHADALSR